MKKQYSKQSAFSLVELSIVLIVIGVLVAGIIQGSSLIRQSKLKAAQMVTQNSPVIKIKNLALWYDATADNSFEDSQRRDGAEVTLWKDVNPSVSSGIDLVENGVGVKNPSYLSSGINGLPSILFVEDDEASYSSSNDALKNESVSYSQIANGNSITIFLVENTSHPLARYVPTILWDKSIGGLNDHISLNPIDKDNKFRAQFGDNTASQITVETVLTGGLSNTAKNDNQIITMVRKSNNVSLRMDGGEITNSNSVTNSLSGVGVLRVGAFAGQIGEIIIFRRGLKNSEIKKVEEYLSKKWGIALSE